MGGFVRQVGRGRKRFIGVLEEVQHHMADVLVSQGVLDLTATTPCDDQPGAAQHPQVLRDEWLADPELIDELVDTSRGACELLDDRQPHRCGQRFEEVDGRLKPFKITHWGETTHAHVCM